MNGALVVLLALIWALVLLPGALRSRRSSPVNSVGTFERAMDILARRDGPAPKGEGRYVYVPRDPGRLMGERSRQRSALIDQRRRTFTRLVVATGATFPLALLVGGAAWLLFLGLAAGLAAYVVLLLRWKAQAEQAAGVVRHLPDVERARDVADERERTPVAVGAESDLYGVPVATRNDEPWTPQSSVRIRRWDDV